MTFSADIIVESHYRRPILMVKCRGAQGTSNQYATRWRQNLIEHGLDPEVPYFLLAFPTRLFLWRANANIEAPPDFAAPAQDVLRRYLGPIADLPGGPRQSLELVFHFWLDDLAQELRQPDPLSEAEQMLVTSGLLEKIKGGLFRTLEPR